MPAVQMLRHQRHVLAIIQFTIDGVEQAKDPPVTAVVVTDVVAHFNLGAHEVGVLLGPQPARGVSRQACVW